MRSLLTPAFLAVLFGVTTLAACGGDDPDDSRASTSNTGASGSSGSGSGGAGGNPNFPPFEPASGGIRRLLKPQYLGSLKVLFGDVAVTAASVPNDQPIKGYDAIGAAELTTPSSSIDTYETSSRNVAAAVVADPATRAKILPCEPASPTDAACLAQFVGSIGRVAWRRSLTQAEIDRIVAAAAVAGNEYGTVDAALEAAISALLQSSYFLYIVELGEPDAEDPTVRRLTPTELATRMSFFLNNATPTKEMLDAAETGALDTDEGIKALAKELLAKPEAKAALDAFYGEIYRLREVSLLQKDQQLFPEFTESLKQSMREETMRFIQDIVWTKKDARELLDADYSFVNAELAALYGVPAPTDGGFAKTTFPAEQQRMGLLGHASLMSVLSHIDSTSPTRRGAFVQSQIFCTPVPPPPGDVTPVLPPDDGKPKSMKQKLEVHMEDPSCNQCHGQMDPIGFALEPFDAIGRFRTVDNGFPIDPSGSVPNLGDFADTAELVSLVREDPRSTKCMVLHFLRHSMGHLETKGELVAVHELEEAFASSGYVIQDMLVELTASRAFRLVGDPK